MSESYLSIVLIVAGTVMVLRPRRSIAELFFPPKDEHDVPWASRESTRMQIGGAIAIAVGAVLLAASV